MFLSNPAPFFLPDTSPTDTDAPLSSRVTNDVFNSTDKRSDKRSKGAEARSKTRKSRRVSNDDNALHEHSRKRRKLSISTSDTSEGSQDAPASTPAERRRWSAGNDSESDTATVSSLNPLDDVEDTGNVWFFSDPTCDPTNGFSCVPLPVVHEDAPFGWQESTDMDSYTGDQLQTSASFMSSRFDGVQLPIPVTPAEPIQIDPDSLFSSSLDIGSDLSWAAPVGRAF